ncbi:DUF2807 domain-containing protein [Flavobacterium cyanobacteriorum]|uniref:DUF2807 domain-containing protein n=1 Tax=Flavobacterium cyanobacteriorum TaxID=2022802 RepID=A0A255Z6Z5_9FLAO|nr:DUF2807 domain-containing protein [Flavobacterium cyanobacteriorum]OYQ37202.1 DUF2807 domain-containing protein [Flavobacterium cyanobacteriorum]
MKKTVLMLLAVTVSVTAFAQKKEKVKGSKIVTVTQKETADFEHLEVEDNIEVFLVKGDKQAIEIEADDNLHEVITSEMYGNTLRLATSKEVTGAKKISVRVIYTDHLKSITGKHQTIINALAELNLPDITIKNLDYSKSFLNVNSANFKLILNDKTKAEVNIKAENTVFELSKNADLKALVASPVFKADLYQKSNMVIEGDAADAKIRLDNNAKLTAKKFTVKNLELTVESYSTCTVLATENISIAASGKTEIQLLGKPKVSILNFADSAVIYKKEQ